MAEDKIEQIKNKAEELSSGGTLHDDEGYIVLPPSKWQLLLDEIARLYEPQPDQSRLLSDEEATTKVAELLRLRNAFPTPEEFHSLHREVQDTETAGIMDELWQRVMVGVNQSHQARIEELIKAYDTYIKALEDENGSLIGLAYTHGWRSSRVEFGEKCRKQIKELKAKYLNPKG